MSSPRRRRGADDTKFLLRATNYQLPAEGTHMRIHAIVLVFLASIVGVHAQQQAVVYDGARLIIGDGKVIESSAFVVENGRIAQVGARGQVKLPPGAARVDLTGK